MYGVVCEFSNRNVVILPIVFVISLKMETGFRLWYDFQAISKNIREHKAKTQAFVDEKEVLMTEQQELVKRKAKLELDINDMQSEMDGDQTAKVTQGILKIH